MVSVEREFEGRNTFAPSINKKSQKLAEAHKAKKEAAEERKVDNAFTELIASATAVTQNVSPAKSSLQRLQESKYLPPKRLDPSQT